MFERFQGGTQYPRCLALTQPGPGSLSLIILFNYVRTQKHVWLEKLERKTVVFSEKKLAPRGEPIFLKSYFARSISFCEALNIV